MKATGVVNYRNLRNTLFKLNTEKGVYIQFDQIKKAKHVFRLGWFQLFHRELHGIGDFFTYLSDKFKAMGNNIRFETYNQHVWVKGDNSTVAHALILDVNSTQKDTALRNMEKLKFDKHFSR